jgi:hypothetical protein
MDVMTLLERFESKYQPVPWSGCWIWTAATKEHGYGVLGLGGRSDGIIKAHRASYMLFRGDIPKDKVVMHLCNNPSCVNPDHLKLGTRKENQRYMVECGRHKFPDNRGERATWSKLNESQVTEVLAAKLNKVKGVGTALARKFGVSKSTIYQIWYGKNWRSISK